MVTWQSRRFRSSSVVPSGTTQMGSSCFSLCSVVSAIPVSLVFFSVETFPQQSTAMITSDRFCITVPSPLSSYSFSDSVEDLVLALLSSFVASALASVQTSCLCSVSVNCCRDDRNATSSRYRRNRKAGAVAIIGSFIACVWSNSMLDKSDREETKRKMKKS